MMRIAFVFILAIVAYCVGAPAIAAADCTSVQAHCAVEAGGRCDAQTGHWCYGQSRSGEACGGSPSAYRTCMARHGVQVYGAQVPKALEAVGTPANPGKCTSIQAQCAMEIGGTCDAKTGHWCYGYTSGYGRSCGGSPHASMEFDDCVSRKLGSHKS
jgi:hypothetical protein